MKNKLFNISLLILWTFICICTIFHHELWRDEAQVWCLARDCSFFEMINNARIEGHPLFWYILIFPFAKLGFSVISMQIFAFVITFICILFLIFKSRLSNFQKFITVFSAGFLYYIPVVVRNYALIPPILFSIVIFYNKRHEHPYVYTLLLILLSHTHSYMIGLSLILSVLFTFEYAKKSVLPSLVLFLNFLLIYFSFSTVLNVNYVMQTKEQQIIPPLELIVLLSKVYLYDIINSIKPLIKYASIISVSCFIPPLICFFAGLFKADKKIFIIALCSVSFILYVFSAIYLFGLLYQKLFLIILILIFSYLLLDNKNKFLNYSLNFLLIISCITSFFVVKNEINYNFSSAKQIADYVKQKYKNEEIIIALGNPYLYASISAYLPNKKLYSPIAKDYISYYAYNPKIANVEIPHNAKLIIADEYVNCEEIGLKTDYKTDEKILSSKTVREVFKICLKSI